MSIVTFDNLWKAFQWTPGTARPRIVLCLWEGVLGAIVYAGGWLGWWGLLAFPVAFFVHELFFRAWVRHVACIPDADDGDVVGRDHKAILTLERWIGPVL